MTNMDRELRIKALVDMLRRQMHIHAGEERLARDQKMACANRIYELETQLSTVTGKPAA